MMNILLPTDVFPPGQVGGSAWSAHTLARALIRRGHMVAAVVPAEQRGRRAVSSSAGGLCHGEEVMGVPTWRYHYQAPTLPILKNIYRHEKLWPVLAEALVSLGREMQQHNSQNRLVIHAQHVQTIPAAVLAGQRLGVPVVATVRDHWPWHYFATGLHGERVPYPYEACVGAARIGGTATDALARLSPFAGVLTLAALPYMLAHVRRRAVLLARATAVVAVSSYIARRLHRLVPPEHLHVIPNMVDCAELGHLATQSPDTRWRGPFLLYVGKLEPNKGAALLVEIMREVALIRRAGEGNGVPLPPLLIVGSGSLQGHLARELARLGMTAHFCAWAPHDEVVRLMARCDLLLFPSAWGEPLSRVLLEASSVGTPILAMPTGGTPDILTDGVNGALAATPASFARRLVALVGNPAQRQQLGQAARHLACKRFSVEAVVPRVENLYELLSNPCNL